MLATMQQAAFGLGSALFGAIFAEVLHSSGDYQHALRVSLCTELFLMLLLLASALNDEHTQRKLARRIKETAVGA
jgi:hypothetical protein